LKVRLHVHLEGLSGVDVPPWELPRFHLGDFEISRLNQSQLPKLARTTAWYAATMKLDLGQTNTLNPQPVYEKVDGLITCLRLFKPGYVGANPLLMDMEKEGTWQRWPLEEGRTARDQQGGMIYALHDKELPKLVDFAKEVFPLISSGRFASLTNPCFQFFNRGINDVARNDFALAIVDFISCLEAVLVPGNAELSHRLSEGVALVTERIPEKRRERYERCKDLYRLRSKVVHGERISYDDAALTLAQSLARYTLRFMIAYYEMGLEKAELVKDIESVSLGETREFPDHAFKFVNDLPIPQSGV